MTVNFRKKKVLITGGSGMQKKFIENQLSKNYHLIAPTRKELNLLDFEKLTFLYPKIKLILLFMLQEE